MYQEQGLLPCPEVFIAVGGRRFLRLFRGNFIDITETVVAPSS
jgi:hypothetical protein